MSVGRTRAIPEQAERLRGVCTTRRYTNTRLCRKALSFTDTQSFLSFSLFFINTPRSAIKLFRRFGRS